MIRCTLLIGTQRGRAFRTSHFKSEIQGSMAAVTTRCICDAVSNPEFYFLDHSNLPSVGFLNLFRICYTYTSLFTLPTNNTAVLNTLALKSSCDYYYYSRMHSDSSEKHKFKYSCMVQTSDDDFRSGCPNVGQYHQQQSFSGLLSPGRSNHTNDSWVQTIYHGANLVTFNLSFHSGRVPFGSF